MRGRIGAIESSLLATSGLFAFLLLSCAKRFVLHTRLRIFVFLFFFFFFFSFVHS